MTNLAAGADIVGSLGGILTGIAEILGLVGAGIGFLVRSRRQQTRERRRTETAATVAAQQAKKLLEAKLDKQHQEQIQQYKEQVATSQAAAETMRKQYEDQIDDMERAQELRDKQFEQQIANLTQDRSDLLSRLLDQNREGKKDA